MKSLSLSVLPDRFGICRLPRNEPIPKFPAEASFWSITFTADGFSIVLPEANIPEHWEAETGWRCLKILGRLNFELTGILASIAVPLANAGVSIFAVSSYDTDYILIRENYLEKARQTLEASGHVVGGCI